MSSREFDSRRLHHLALHNRTLINPKVQEAIRARIAPRMKRLGLTLDNTLLDNTLEELRRLAYARPGEPFEDGEGELAPVKTWPNPSAPARR